MNGALLCGDITQDEYDIMEFLFIEKFTLKEQLIEYQTLRILKDLLLSADKLQWKDENIKILFLNMINSIDIILINENKVQKRYEFISSKLEYEYSQIFKRQNMVILCDHVVAYRGYPEADAFDHTIQLGDDINNPYDPVYIGEEQEDQQANCYRVDMEERDRIPQRDWYSYMNRSLETLMGYYVHTNELVCTEMEDDIGLNVTLDDQEFQFYLVDGKWWVDENGRYLITVGPNVLNMEYNGGSLEFTDFKPYFGCRIDVVLAKGDEILTLECIYAGDIKAHTADNGVYMTGRSFLSDDEDEIPDGSIVEFIGNPNLKDENDPEIGADNGSMSGYKVELMIVYDNAAEVN